jgi:hypothetical protein
MRHGETRNAGLLLTAACLITVSMWSACSSDSTDPSQGNPVMGGPSAPAAGSGTTPVTPNAGTGSPASAGRSAVGAAGRSTGAAGATTPPTGVAGTTATVATAGSPGTGDIPVVTSGTGGSLAGVAGIGALAGASGSPTGAAGSGTPTPREDLGKGDGSDVITIGDSWMNLGATGIELSLVRLSGQPYRTYGVAGTQLLNGQIPSQYANAKRENPDIKTVVMTGGGNDLLLTGAGADRSSAGPASMMQIDMIAARLVEIWNEMSTDGVKDVVYIEYSRGGSSEAAVNYATEKIKPLCDAASPVRCHWIDSDIYIMMQLADTIHPTGDGCDKIATGIIDLMEKEGLRR